MFERPDTFSDAARGCSSVRRSGFLSSINFIRDQIPYERKARQLPFGTPIF